MKLTFCITFFVILFLYVSQMEVTFNPFSISLPYWHRSVGILLVMVGIVLYCTGERIKGYEVGHRDGVEWVIKQLKDKSNNQA